MCYFFYLSDVIFFFKQKTAYEMRISDWSSDVCSSDLVSDPALVQVFERIYEDTATHWREYALCEDLVDLESQFQTWRFRHMRTVMRIIGFRPGTGGSSGVGFLKQALDLTFFPEIGRATSELQSLMRISYAVFCLKNKKNQ